MPTTLGTPFPAHHAGLPTHMSTEDYRLWLTYRLTIQAAAPTLYFDVRLGGTRALDHAPPEYLKNFWYSVNAKRADVVAEYADHVDLIELRTRAQPNAIGRLITYRELWNDDPAILKPLRLELVTDSEDPDVRRVADLVGIKYTVLHY
jgi:hypothetical protein